MKRNLLLGVFCLLGLSVLAQQNPVLMRINDKEVLRSEFEAAYNKQRSLAGADVQPLAAYVDWFVNFQLKLSAAQSAGIDTTLAFRDKISAHRVQLAMAYLTDKEAEEANVQQAYNRAKAYSQPRQVQVMQVFISLPQTFSATRIRAAEVQMDSIYVALKNSTDADFATFVAKYSDDKQPFWVGRLQSTEEFETIVFALQRGEISRPFYTPQGLHIVRVIDRKEPSLEAEYDKRRRLLLSRREVDKSTKPLIRQLKSEYAYTPNASGVEELLSKGETLRPLFTLDGRVYSGVEFKRFAASYPRGVKTQLDAFVAKAVLETENARLEQKHPAFHQLLQKHRDSLLLSQITEREIGTQAVTDKTGLSTYFKLHRSDYNWKQPRYRGIVLHCADKKTLRRAKKLARKMPESEWTEILGKTFNTLSQKKVKIEQGLFAEGDNKYIDKLVFKRGTFEPIESYPFTAVLGKKQKGPDNYKEVSEALATDYREFLDSLWIKRLRAAGKVEINQEVLKTVNNH